MGIPFSLTNIKYNEKTYATYMPSSWYKNLWRFMSTPIFNLEVTEDYQDMLILCEKGAYLMEAFVDGGFRNADLKAFNFVRKYLQAVTLSNIVTSKILFTKKSRFLLYILYTEVFYFHSALLKTAENS